MTFSSLSCPACGAREIVRREGRYSCAFCRSTVVPRLTEGSVCDDVSHGAHCGELAETMCKGCARPLCDRHNDPKAVYWHAPLHWRLLCSGWQRDDGRFWDQISRPTRLFPFDDFQPFEWVFHDRQAQYAVGVLEGEIHEAVKAVARPAGGDVDDNAARFESLCTVCEAEVEAGIQKTVGAFAARYRDVAYRDRAAALARETGQAVRYVEAFLQRPISERPGEGDPPTSVGPDSPRREWDAFGQVLQERAARLERLAEALGERPTPGS